MSHAYKKKILSVLVCAVCLLSLASLSLAQEEGVGDGKQRTKSGIRSDNAIPPPPAGLKLLYVFSGARDNWNVAGGLSISTSVQCTNFDDVAIRTQVEIYDKFGDWHTSTSTDIPAGYTYTFSTNDTALYYETFDQDVMFAIEQGFGRVLIKDDKWKLVCSAQVLDSVNPHPDFIVSLPMHRIENNKVVVVPMF